MHVPQVELRQEPEGLDGKYPEIVEDPFHLLGFGLQGAIDGTAEAQVILFGLIEFSIMLKVDCGPNHLPVLDCLSYLVQSLGGAESVTVVQHDRIAFGVAALGDCNFNVSDLVAT